MKQFDLFIFDFDGTLADSRINIANSTNFALKQLGIKPIQNELIFPTIGNIRIQNAIKMFYPEVTPAIIDRFTELYRTYLVKHAIKEITFFPGVKQTLESLAKRGKVLAILTTKNAEIIQKVLETFDLASLFTVIYGSGMPGGNKPDKGCVEYIVNHTSKDIETNKIVMVGDTVVDLQTAQNAFIASIGVTYGIEGENIRKLGFTYLIDHFDEILRFSL